MMKRQRQTSTKGLHLPDLHRVRKRLRSGGWAVYLYAHRGGPQIARIEGATRGVCDAQEREQAAEITAAYAVARSQQRPASSRMSDLIIAYKGAPDGLLRLKASTAREWRRHLDQISEDFGDMPIKALEAKGARRLFLDWRDKMAASPRKADYRMQVLRRVLSWSLDRDLIKRNPVLGIEGLYKADRADVIIEDHELDAILRSASPASRDFIALAALTGMRRGDLVDLKWSNVEPKCIRLETAKSNGKRRIIVPLFPDAQRLLDDLRTRREQLLRDDRVPPAHVLLTQHGTPWTKDGPTQAFIRAAKASGIDKHLHDLRGTAATRFAIAGLSDETIAEILGWEPNRVRAIRRYYVDHERIAQSVIEQLTRSSA